MIRIQLYIFLFFFTSTNAQVLNIDRNIATDSIIKKWVGFTTLNFSSDKIKKDYLDGSVKTEIVRTFSNDYLFVGMFNYDFSVNGSTILQNDGFLQLRYRDNDKHEWSNESYLQYQWNGPLGMIYRNVVGSNLRKRFFEKKRVDLYSGLGVFYEGEKWNWNGVENEDEIALKPIRDRRIFRLNHYWKMAYKVNDQLDLSAISYFQFPINSEFQNLRWFFDLNAFIKISKKLNFVVHWDHTYDGYRLVPISYFYYSLNFGIQFNW